MNGILRVICNLSHYIPVSYINFIIITARRFYNVDKQGELKVFNKLYGYY